MDLVVVVGKSKKNVQAYILNPPDAKDALNVLNHTRDEVKVSQTNPYIFSRLNSDLGEIVAVYPDLKENNFNNIEKVCRVCIQVSSFSLTLV